MVCTESAARPIAAANASSKMAETEKRIFISLSPSLVSMRPERGPLQNSGPPDAAMAVGGRDSFSRDAPGLFYRVLAGRQRRIRKRCPGGLPANAGQLGGRD